MKFKLKYADVVERFPVELEAIRHALKMSKSKFKNNPIESFNFHIKSFFSSQHAAVSFYDTETVNERLRILLNSTKATLVVSVPKTINAWYHVLELKVLPAEVVIHCITRTNNL